MPVLKFKIDNLLKNIPHADLETIRDTLFRLKCETEILEDGFLEVEINPDRPDMYSLEGLVRAVKGLLELERGWSKPSTHDTGIVVEVSSVASRPYIATAVVYNVNIRDDEDLRQLIQFQEKLHDTIGRRRRKVAIGFHDLDKLPSKQIYYKALRIDEIEFPPLGIGYAKKASKILIETEQGQKYGHISLKDKLHPFLLSGSDVIAMPPVINSNITRIEVGTKHLFIDVTGTSKEAVEKVLDIIVSNLAERKGASIGQVKVLYNDVYITYPSLRTIETVLDLDYVNNILGYSLEPHRAIELLGYMRYNAYFMEGKRIRVEVPPFRADYISPIDLVEDIAIAIGYEKLQPCRPEKYTRGQLLYKNEIKRILRDLLVGMGFTEVMQLSLVSPDDVEPIPRKPVFIKNPVQRDYSVLRTDLIISLLGVLRQNQLLKKPVKLFEIGRIAYLAENQEIVEKDMIALAVMDDEMSIEKIQSPLYTLLDIIGIEYSISSECTEQIFIQGRCGSLLLGNQKLAEFGEVNPEILEKQNIEYPTAYANIDLEVLTKWSSKTLHRQ
ncbi:MAG: phenylalanine--tRNA ligase subunit beta [Desulfurococcales archaeon]|nr:phenylalanine--tRNA ligase subunit beta [Desulfurococcales archaeon]